MATRSRHVTWGDRGGCWTGTTGLVVAVMGMAALAGLVLPTQWAHAQELIAREMIDLDADTLVAIDDLEYLREVAKLTPEQFDSAQELLAGARDNIQRIKRKQRRARITASMLQDEEAQSKAEDASTRTYVEDLANTERAFMVDLKDLLDASQQEGWARFERMRRRMLIRGTMDIQRVDLVSFLLRSVETIASPALASEVETYEKELDMLVQQRRALAKQIGRNYLTQRTEGEKDDAKIEQDIRDIAARICELQTRTARRFMENLPPDAKEEFERRWIRASFNAGSLRMREQRTISELTRLSSLDAAQRRRMDDIVREADQSWLALARLWIPYWEQVTLSELRNTPEPAPPAGEYFDTRLDQLTRATIARIMDVLTPAQREAYVDGAQLDEDRTARGERLRRQEELEQERREE